jgi:hypothetical protein
MGYAIVLYVILLFVINRLLIPGSQPALRNGRKPAGDVISQPTSRFFFESFFTGIALAKSMPSTFPRHPPKPAVAPGGARNTLRRNELETGQLKISPA